LPRSVHGEPFFWRRVIIEGSRTLLSVKRPERVSSHGSIHTRAYEDKR
jgi:hypothetical protein